MGSKSESQANSAETAIDLQEMIGRTQVAAVGMGQIQGIVDTLLNRT
jgi:hypothetical protein